MAPAKKGNLLEGAVLQFPVVFPFLFFFSFSLKAFLLKGTCVCLEAASLGMPFEVWKTRMGRYRHESTFQAFTSVYKAGGLKAFWKGTSAKMVESATKGAILLFAKEGIMSSLTGMGVGSALAGMHIGRICIASTRGFLIGRGPNFVFFCFISHF